VIENAVNLVAKKSCVKKKIKTRDFFVFSFSQSAIVSFYAENQGKFQVYDFHDCLQKPFC